MQLSEAILAIRTGEKMSQREFAEAIGRSLRTIGGWERGETKPHMGDLRKMASKLGCDTWEELLAKHTGAQPFSRQVDPGVRIPVFEEVPAGAGDFDPTDLGEDNGFASQWIDAQILPPFLVSGHRDAFGLRVRGDSMMPDYQDGDLIICSASAPQEPGMVAVFRLVGGECGLKIIESAGKGMIRLVPLNPRAGFTARIVPIEEVTRLARVIWHARAMVPSPHQRQEQGASSAAFHTRAARDQAETRNTS